MEPYGWAICKGGSNQLAQAMAAFTSRTTAARSASTRRSRRIEVDGGWSARGRCSTTASAFPVDGHPRLEPGSEATRSSSWSASGSLDATSRHACERWRYDVMSMFCVYLALDAPVRWKAARLTSRRRDDASPSRCASRSTSWTTTRRTAGWACRRGSPGSSPCTPRSSSRGSARPARRRASRADRAVRAARGRSTRRGTTTKDDYAEHGPCTGGGRSWRAGSSPKPWSAATSRARSTSSV